jgi:hypothetical protein
VILGPFSCTTRTLHCTNFTSYFFGRKSVINAGSNGCQMGYICHVGDTVLVLYRDYPTDILGCFFSRRHHADPPLIISYRRLISVFRCRDQPRDSYPPSVLHDESTRQLNDGDQSKLGCIPHFDSGKIVNTSMGSFGNRRTRRPD